MLATPTHPDESHLLRRLLRGDEAAFTALVRSLGPSMLRLARAILGNDQTAQEVVQETWLAAIGGLATFEERSSLKTWLFRILVNRAKTRRAREARTVPFSSIADGDCDAPAVDARGLTPDGAWANPAEEWDRDTPERLAIQTESRMAIDAALLKLPPQQRAVVTLRDVHGLSAEEVCSLLGLSEANQRVLLHRGREKARAQLEAYLFGSAGQATFQRPRSTVGSACSRRTHAPQRSSATPENVANPRHASWAPRSHWWKALPQPVHHSRTSTVGRSAGAPISAPTRW